LVALLAACGSAAAPENTGFVKLTSAEASSTISQEENSPLRVSLVCMTDRQSIQPGTSYWCSTGGHSESEKVTWTGHLAQKRRIKGVKIRWAYGPGRVEIATSVDGKNFDTAAAWREEPVSEEACKEHIMFATPKSAKAVQIIIKGPLQNYFGITQELKKGEADAGDDKTAAELKERLEVLTMTRLDVTAHRGGPIQPIA